MAKKLDVRPNSEFYWGALAMKSAMMAAFDAHAQNIELGFPPELVLNKLREHFELISAEMVVRDISVEEKTG